MGTSINGQTGNITPADLLADIGGAVGGGGATQYVTSGRYVAPLSDAGLGSNGPNNFAPHVAIFAPIRVSSTTTFDRIAIGITYLGEELTSGTDQVRVGVYANLAGYPVGPPLLDGGLISLTSEMGDVGNDIDLTLDPGQYWLAWVMDDSTYANDDPPGFACAYPDMTAYGLSELTSEFGDQRNPARPPVATTFPTTGLTLPTLAEGDAALSDDGSIPSFPLVALRVV